jgi:hypothetical protein
MRATLPELHTCHNENTHLANTFRLVGLPVYARDRIFVQKSRNRGIGAWVRIEHRSAGWYVERYQTKKAALLGWLSH